ncbi:MAG TPA: ABC transporter permease [Spirochaetota bacterium]|nr:ABC transporter permease [Spirochaetota bacterium]HNT10407.1 ABC transporter permease [Spirochaetota bacterium]HNV46451.1 ABC transporter permease [Spirochaetota bacterium]HOS41284.1 ABC transporter permease [Spirochaetota bacterium]HPI23333.1 ABC transporter permease [Spirochaetota bacterium]
MMLSRSIIRIAALAEKEWIQIRRDTRSLILSIFLPVFLLLIFGYALTMDVKRVSTAVVDQDHSRLSRRFVEKFAHTEYISLYGHVRSTREIDALIDRGDIIMAIVIPRNFERMHQSGKRADIQLVVDGSDSTSATVAIGYVKSILFEFNNENKIRELGAIGIASVAMPVEVRSRIWYNAELKSKNFIVPGIIVIVMSIVSALITSLTISREWERGTMETLITTPVRKFEVFLGKLVPYILIGLFDIILTIAVGFFVFKVPLRGSFIELCLVSLLFLVGTSSIGIMISSATRSQVLSVQIAINLTYLPTIILSGYVFPIKNMPAFVQAITYLIPARYLISYMKGITMKGIGYTVLWSQILFLFLFALGVALVSLRKLSLRLPEK